LKRERGNDILELNVDPVENNLAKYKPKWLNHVSRMERNYLDTDLSEEDLTLKEIARGIHTTERRVLGFRIVQKASRYGGQLRIH
jgi:hypothetical protein